MEKAILKTLIYADIFDYPLKTYQIHKWLIGKQVSLRQVEEALDRLNKKSKVKSKKGYFFLPGRNRLVTKRLSREKNSKSFFRRAKFTVWFIKFIPWIKLIGISGGVAVDNAEREDDIDLFIVTSKNRLWLSRILVISFLNYMGVRRKANMKPSQVAGKLCTNILVEEDKLEQTNQDIFVAHEVLQMKVLWSRGGVYKKYLEDNSWAFKFLPNWIGNRYIEYGISYIGKKQKNLNTRYQIQNTWFDYIEHLAKNLQLKIMGQPKGMERIQDGALYFHPNDIRPKVLAEYRSRIKNI